MAAFHIQNVAHLIDDWSANWLGKPQKIKTGTILTAEQVHVNINYVRIPTASSAKFLSVSLDSNLHIRHTVQKTTTTFYWHSMCRLHTVQKARQRFNLRHILRSQSKTPTHLKRLIYLSYIRPIWQYACLIWNSASNIHINQIQVLQNRILRMAIGAPWYVRNTTIHRDIKIPLVKETLHNTYLRHQSTLKFHPNPLIRQISQNMLPD